MALVLVEGDSLLPDIVGASVNTTTPETSRPSGTDSSADQLAISRGGVVLVIVLLSMLFI